MKLQDVRVKIDQMSERIVSGLKDRSRYSLSAGVFSEEAYDGKTWFNSRLLGEQSLDAIFGRYEFEDQHPLLFTKEVLPASKIKRNPPSIGVARVGIDVGNKVIDLYKKALEKICLPGEDKNNYGEIAKLDVSNVLALYERICGIGQEVAELKIQENTGIIYLDKETITEKLRNTVREQEVIDSGIEIARRYLLPNPETMSWFFRNVIDITLLGVEVDYVLRKREKINNEPRIIPGLEYMLNFFKRFRNKCSSIKESFKYFQRKN